MSIDEFKIPEITDEKLLKMYESIKPVIYDKSVHMYRPVILNIEKGELKNKAFTWSPEFEKDNCINPEELEYIKTIEFLSESYCGMWKPSVSEVFAFAQNDEDIARDAFVFQVEFEGHHESGRRNMGIASFYRKKVKVKPKSYKRIKIENDNREKIIIDKFSYLEKLDSHHEACPTCKNRLDNTVNIHPLWLEEKLKEYNNFIVSHLKDNTKEDLKILEDLKFKFLNKLLNRSIRRVKKEKQSIIDREEREKNSNN